MNSTMLMLAAGSVLALAGPAAADRLEETGWEQRTVVYLTVPDQTLQRLLPPGWRAVAFDAGPGKGANVTLNLSEPLATLNASGAAVEARGHGLTFSAHVVGPGSTSPDAMVLFGMTDGDDVPGPYGAHRAARMSLDRSSSDASGRTVREHWRATDRQGDQLDVRLAYVPGAAVETATRQTTRSALHPDFSRQYRVQLVSRPVTAAAGSPLAVAANKGVPQQLWPSGRAPVAVVSAPVYHREIWLQDAARP